MNFCARAWLAALLFCVPLVAALADAPTTVPVRVGNHPGYGRIVLDFASRPDYQLSRQGGTVVLKFDGDVTIGASPSLAHNILAITGGAGQITIVAAPDTVVRDWRLGDRVVIDVFDPGTDQNTPQGPAPVPIQPKPPQTNAANARSPTSPPGQPADAPPTVASAGPAAKAAAQTKSTSDTAPSAHPAAPAAGVVAKSAAPTWFVPLHAMPPAPEPSAAALAKPAEAPPGKPAAETAPAPIAEHPGTEIKPTLPGAAASLASSPTNPPSPSPAVPPGLAASRSPPASADGTISAEPTTESTDAAAATLPPTLDVPFDSSVGAAAFRRGNTGIVVFDRRMPIDLPQLGDDPLFGSAVVVALPTATLLVVRLEPDTALAIALAPHAWHIATVATLQKLRPITSAIADGRVNFSAVAPGAVVTFADPETGATLLVGTQRQSGESMAVRRRAVEFTLQPTWQGVVVEPMADSLTLRPTPTGFVLAAGPRGLALTPPGDTGAVLANAASLTQVFSFPNEPTGALLQRLHEQVVEASAAPALARGPQRRAAAQTMIALGMGAEAQALLQLAAADDPREAARPENAALTSVAAILAHRPADAAAWGDQLLSGADDVALWQALRLAELSEGSPRAAAIIATSLPLILAYPPPLRDRLLSLAAETLVAGGETAAAATLLDDRKDDGSLDLARGMLKEAQGDTDGALAVYDKVTQSPDRLLHARSATRAVELRFASGSMDAQQAAAGLDKLLYAWRGDLQEKLLRERVAELKTRAGEWRAALALLRETEMLFPDDKAEIHGWLTSTFAALLRGDAAEALKPLELAALADENSDLLPTGPEGELLQGRLADRLAALDLPKRAEPVLAKLMQSAPTGVGRAGFGARLAAMRLREGDAAGALAALAASDNAALPADLAERRTLLFAAATARRGDTQHALEALTALGTTSADEARASILERTNDWPAAEQALVDYASRTVPAQGELDDGQRQTMLRLATAAARAGDQTTLTGLRTREASRMASGPLADMFRLLTADPVRGVADLKRSGQEAVLAHELPGQLKALQPGARQAP